MTTYLIVGLGNPGDRYRNTRHNIGFMVADAVGEQWSIPIETQKFDALIGRGMIGNAKVILIKPMSFMNLSGHPVARIASYFGINGKELLVIHDDIDLAFGRIKFKEKGGHGGHKGIQSVAEVLGTNEFGRLRIGVGRSEAGNVVHHVLGDFSNEEHRCLSQIITAARDAVVMFLQEGITAGMNRFNNKNILIA